MGAGRIKKHDFAGRACKLRRGRLFLDQCVFQMRLPILKDRERIALDLYVFGFRPPEPREFTIWFEDRYGIGLHLADLPYAEVFVVVENSDTLPFRAECHLAFYVC